MKIFLAAAAMLLAASPAIAQKAETTPKTDPKAPSKTEAKADAKGAAKPDTRSDYLRTESVKAPEKKPASNVRLNLNSASPTQLGSLPGIHGGYVKAIIKGRPYRSRDELLTRKILPKEVFEEVKTNLYAGR